MFHIQFIPFHYYWSILGPTFWWFLVSSHFSHLEAKRSMGIIIPRLPPFLNAFIYSSSFILLFGMEWINRTNWSWQIAHLEIFMCKKVKLLFVSYFSANSFHFHSHFFCLFDSSKNFHCSGGAVCERDFYSPERGMRTGKSLTILSLPPLPLFSFLHFSLW